LILEEDWPHWTSVDRDIPSYARWVELFDKNLKVAEARGWPYERVPVRPDAFNEWCKTNKLSADKYNRSLYALKMLQNGQKPPEVTPDLPQIADESAIEVSSRIEASQETVEPSPAITAENEITVPAA